MEKAEEMKQPGVDLKEALAKLSEMQAKIAAQQAQYNVGLVDAQLQSLGAAMQAAEATDAAGSALQDGKFDQAVKELEKLETPPTREEGGQDPRGEAQAGRQADGRRRPRPDVRRRDRDGRRGQGRQQVEVQEGHQDPRRA